MDRFSRFARLVAIAVVSLGIFTCSRPPRSGGIVKVNGYEMVYVPGGRFMMGDSSGEHFQVSLKPYLIDKYEVTNGAFRAFARTFRLPFPVPPSYDELPVVNVSWETADAFAAWRGVRLPTEAEWELAARGTDGRRYPWGYENDPSKTNSDDGVDPMTPPDGSKDGFASVAPVGMFPQGASPFGVLDMAGNVWEWVNDWYAPYPDSARADYRGPATGERKVLRGGSYSCGMPNHRTFHRAYHLPAAIAPDLGFRCGSDYPPLERGAVPPEHSATGDTTK